jgi:hypothetical protein
VIASCCRRQAVTAPRRRGKSRSCVHTDSVVFALQPRPGMQPVNLVREVPTQLEVHAWFWKVVAGAALCSFMAVVLLAWQQSHVRTRHVHVVTHAMCSASSSGGR